MGSDRAPASFCGSLEGGKNAGKAQEVREAAALAEGTVLWYSPQIGYGFILDDALEEGVNERRKVFVDSTSITGDEALEMGDKVTFEKASGEQGVEARNVVKAASLRASTGGIPKKLRAGLL